MASPEEEVMSVAKYLLVLAGLGVAAVAVYFLLRPPPPPSLAEVRDFKFVVGS